MDLLFTMLVPFLMLAVALWGLVKRVDLWGALTDGAEKGLKVSLRIMPPLIGLLTAVYMLRASGALELLGELAGPLLAAAGIPAETIGLLLVRPVSGSAALGVGAELIQTYGPDSLVGRTAAVMLGSTETTFYTIAMTEIGRDDLLYHRGVFRRGEDWENPVCGPGGVVRGRGGVFGGVLGGAAVVLTAVWGRADEDIRPYRRDCT